MELLRFLGSIIWRLLQFILIQTDRDYWRMIAVLDRPHSAFGYWKFVEWRKDVEQRTDYDRTNKAQWSDAADRFEEEDQEEKFDDDTGQNGEKEVPGLSHAERLLGLKAGSYTEKDLKRAFAKAIKKAHPDHGGSGEEARAVNMARDIIRRANGWG